MTITEFEQAVKLHEQIKTIKEDIRSLSEFQSNVNSLKLNEGVITVITAVLKVDLDFQVGMQAVTLIVEDLWTKLANCEDQFFEILNPESPVA
jgi:hypothetical protein